MAPRNQSVAVQVGRAANDQGAAAAQPNRPGRLGPRDAQLARKARAAAECTQDELADLIDAQRSRVQRFEDPAAPHYPNTRELRQGPEQWALYWLRLLAAERRASVQPMPAIVHGEDHVARLTSLVTEGSDPARSLSRALAPSGPGGRRLTDAELEDFERECREGAEVFLEGATFAALELQRRRAAR